MPEWELQGLQASPDVWPNDMSRDEFKARYGGLKLNATALGMIASQLAQQSQDTAESETIAHAPNTAQNRKFRASRGSRHSPAHSRG